MLLTLTHIGGAEGYYNRFVCLSVCVFVCLFVCRQNSSEPMNIGTLKILPAGVESYKDQK